MAFLTPLPDNPEPPSFPAVAARRGALALTAVCLAWMLLIVFWDRLYLLLTVDDTYYYLKTAVNLAGGHGSTFDQLNPTNGYHPLWMALLVPLAKLTNAAPNLARLALLLQVGLVYAGVRLLRHSLIPGSAALPGLAALALMPFYAAKILVNGQESALHWLLLCATLACLWRLQRRPALPGSGPATLLGLLCGLTVLARLDAILFALPVLLAPLWLPAPAWNDATASGRLRFCFIGLLACGLLLLPYLVWNEFTFGHLLPISGAVKVLYASLLVPWWVRLLGALSFLALALWTVSRARCSHADASLRWLAPLALYVCLQTACSMALFGRLLPGIWYAVPHLLLALLTTSFWWGRQVPSPAPRRHTLALVALACLVAVTWAARLHPISTQLIDSRLRVSHWLQTNTPPDAVLAGWDCGIVGAHADRRLVNLDGLINSWDYKTRYLQTGQTGVFITAVQPVDYLVQYFDPAKLRRAGLRHKHVALADWRVVYAEPLQFRSLARSWRTRQLVYFVLKPVGPGPRLSEYFENH